MKNKLILTTSFLSQFGLGMKILPGLILILTLLLLAMCNSYSQKSFRLFNPFTIHVDPMESVLLVNFEKDPDEIYIGFEPQVFDDKMNGKGHLIIGWRVDGKVDVYHQPSLTTDPAKFDIAGKGLANMVSVDMPFAAFEVDDFGVQADYQFKDIQNRSVKIKIHEHNTKKRKPFGLLAPMGDAAENPSALPLVLLHDFYFVRRKNTDFHISIDDKIHKPDQLHIPMDWTGMYFTRYSPKPLIATFNPAFNGALSPIDIEQGMEQFNDGNLKYELEWEAQVPNLKSLTRVNEVHPIQLTFNPAFPNLAHLPAGFSKKGNFQISGHPSTGFLSGNYLICAGKENTILVLVPSKGWKPRPTKFSLWFLYTVGRIFKQWPTTYRWEAKLEKTQNEGWFMQSNWKRTARVLEKKEIPNDL